MSLADDAPRGFVLMSEYTRAQNRIDELEAELNYARWLLGENTDALDELRGTLAAHRIKSDLHKADMRFMLRLVRAPAGGAIRADRPVEKLSACKLRAAIRKSRLPRAPAFEVIETVNRYGYVLNPKARAFVRAWVPELFMPKAELVSDHVDVDPIGQRRRA